MTCWRLTPGEESLSFLTFLTFLSFLLFFKIKQRVPKEVIALLLWRPINRQR